MKSETSDATTSTFRDPIDDLFKGIHFRSKTDKDLLYVRFSKHVSQSNAITRISQDLDNDKQVERLHKTIYGLRYELQRAHRQWAEQVIEARSGDIFQETTIERSNVALGGQAERA